MASNVPPDGEGGGGRGGGGGGVRGPGGSFDLQMSQADKKLLKECRDEAFYSRSLPLMVAMCGGTHALVKIGKLSPHPKYGSLFKVMWAAFFGNIIGKITYQGQCNNKLMADPNSLLGRSLRQRLGQTVLEPTDPAVIDMIQKRESPAAADVNAASGYDQLRQRNRQYGSSPPPSAPAPPNASPLPPEFPSEDSKIDEVPIEERPMNRRMPIPKPKINKYGDVVEDD